MVFKEQSPGTRGVIRFPRPAVTYAFAAAVALLALGATALVPYTLRNSIYAFAFAGVILAAWYGGLRPALLTAVLAAAGV